jgi:hypothetical protein
MPFEISEARYLIGAAAAFAPVLIAITVVLWEELNQ